jgi:hypothetical protein
VAQIEQFFDAWVTGLGLTTALSHDARSTCAAARAGMLRPSKLEAFKVPDPDDMEGVPVTVHAARSVTRGFENDPRLVRLLQSAFDDLRATTLTNDVLQGRRIRFYLGLPDPDRLSTGTERIPEADRPPAEAQDAQPSNALLIRGEAILRSALSQTFPKGSPHDARHLVLSGIATGAAALFHLVRQATLDLRAQHAEFAVIATVDSLLDQETLGWLEKTRRLKTPDRPTGFMPGEAGAVLLVEAPHHARARGVSALATLPAMAFDREPNSIVSGRNSRGEALAATVLAALPHARWSDTRQVWVIADQDGEEYRASEWGNALTHLVRQSELFTSPSVWFPASSLGHTGVAAAAIGVCTAARAFARRYAPASTAMITCSADSGERVAAIVAAPEG